jgi:hypothetical protein
MLTPHALGATPAMSSRSAAGVGRTSALHDSLRWFLWLRAHVCLGQRERAWIARAVIVGAHSPIAEAVFIEHSFDLVFYRMPHVITVGRT